MDETALMQQLQEIALEGYRHIRQLPDTEILRLAQLSSWQLGDIIVSDARADELLSLVSQGDYAEAGLALQRTFVTEATGYLDLLLAEVLDDLSEPEDRTAEFIAELEL